MKGADSFDRSQNVTPQAYLSRTVRKSCGTFLSYHSSEVCAENECEFSSSDLEEAWINVIPFLLPQCWWMNSGGGGEMLPVSLISSVPISTPRRKCQTFPTRQWWFADPRMLYLLCVLFLLGAAWDALQFPQSQGSPSQPEWFPHACLCFLPPCALTGFPENFPCSCFGWLPLPLTTYVPSLWRDPRFLSTSLPPEEKHLIMIHIIADHTLI